MAENILLHSLFTLLIAIAASAVFHRLRLPVILAYVFTGLLSGPACFNWFDQQQMHWLAEFGVTLLMFSLGLEFSFAKVWSMRHQVFGVGMAQVALTWLVTCFFCALVGLSATTGLIVGAALSLSSTAIVLKILNQLGWLNRDHGRMTVSVLLFQDMAVVPFLVVISLLQKFDSLSWFYLLSTTASTTMALMMLLALARWLLPQILNEVAQVRSHELFVLSALGVVLVMSVMTQQLGLSMALGAFMGGMLLSESQYKSQLEADIRPFRDILLGVFFISIGMLIDLQVVASHAGTIVFALIGIMLFKLSLVLGVLRVIKVAWFDAIVTSLSLAQVGEFSFVILALAVQDELLPPVMNQILVIVAVLSMAVSAYILPHSYRIARFFAGKVPQHFPDENDLKPVLNQGVLLLGYGRVGQTITRFLKMESIGYAALDLEPERVREAQSLGEPVFFGDARSHSILKKMGLKEAKLVVITFAPKRCVLEVMATIKRMAPAVDIVVRTQDDRDMTELEAAGAYQVVPEKLEGSLMLVSQILDHCSVPLKQIMRLLNRERQLHYPDLHHFFDEDESEYEDIKVHAISLADGSFMVGTRVQDLSLHQIEVQIKAICRAGEAIENPPQDWELAVGDVLLLIGQSHSLEQAENYLHLG
ncbi:MAG: cation:proton antiporter [Shewanellaceae bacterium]|nr:cation:proton antiporter [Shewanellaceae bacterium]